MSADVAGPMLATREQPPEMPTVAPATGTFDFEPTYSGNVGNDMGISTMGFRSAKYNPPEWHENNYSKYYQSFSDRDNSERVRHESKRTIKETEAQTQKTQSESTKKLAERLKDINFWKFELNREIQDVIAETDLLLEQKKRLENALRATEIPLHIATDNLNCRQRRQGLDLVQDDVELNLLKVSLLISCVLTSFAGSVRNKSEKIIGPVKWFVSPIIEICYKCWKIYQPRPFIIGLGPTGISSTVCRLHKYCHIEFEYIDLNCTFTHYSINDNWCTYDTVFFLKSSSPLNCTFTSVCNSDQWQCECIPAYSFRK